MQSEKLERLKTITEVLNEISSNLSGAYKGLMSEGMTPRNAKTICMFWAKSAFMNKEERRLHNATINTNKIHPSKMPRLYVPSERRSKAMSLLKLPAFSLSFGARR